MKLTQINSISTPEDKNKGLFLIFAIYFTNTEWRLAFSFFSSFLFFSVLEINCNYKSLRGRKSPVALDSVQIQNKKDGDFPKRFSKAFDITDLSHYWHSLFQFLKLF